MATPSDARPTTSADQEPRTAGARWSRRLLAGTAAVALAVPVSFALAGSSSAAPSLTIAQAQAQLTALQAKEDVADEAFNQATLASQQAQAKVKAAAAAVASQQRKVAGMQKTVASFAAASYTAGGLSPVDTLLAGGTPQQVLSRAASVDEVARSQSSALLALHAQSQQLVNTQHAAADTAKAAAASATKLDASRKQITGVIAQEQAVLAHMQAEQRAALLAQQAQQAAASRAAARAALSKALTSNPTTSTRGSLPSAPAPAQTIAVSGGNHGATAIRAAESVAGDPYVYGAAGPSSFDCSGLVMWAFAHAGVSLPHSAAGQYGYGTHVPVSQLQPGDIVFYNEGGSIGHDGIYVGNGQMIDANHTGGSVGIRGLYSGLIGGTRL